MAEKWYTRLVKRLLGQQGSATTVQELRLKRLEDRRLLNADFMLSGVDMNILTLENFDAGTGTTEVVVYQDTYDFGSGNEDVYIFDLDGGDWIGTDVAGQVEVVSGNPNRLAVAKSVFDTAAGGSITIDDAAANNDVIVDFGNGSDLDITSDNGTLNISITSTGDVTQDPGGALVNDGLISMTNVGDVTLTDTDDFNDFSSISATSRGMVFITDTNDLTVTGITTDIDDASDGIDDDGDVTVSVGGNLTISGAINTTGDSVDAEDDDISLMSDGTLNINQALNAGEGDVSLTADGAIAQNTDGLITANELSVELLDVADDSMDENIDLGEDNSVDVFAASNASDNGMITFHSTEDLEISTVGSVIGVSTTDGAGPVANDITISTDGTLTINQAINAGTADVRLVADGAITQDAVGLITANELGVRLLDVLDDSMDEHIDLGYANLVDEFAALNQSDDGMITFKSARNLTIGEVTAKGAFALTSGVTSTYTGAALRTDDGDTHAGDILIESEGYLFLDYAVNAMTADVRLVAQGDIGQDADGLITANELGVRQNRATYLAGADRDADNVDDHHIDLGYRNYVDEVAAYNAEDGSMVTLKSRRNLTVGSVDAKPTVDPADGHAYFAATTGVTSTYTGAALRTDDGDTHAGDILIESEGYLFLDYAVNAMTADVRLVAQGDIGQDADGLITANELGVRQNRATYLAGADRDADNVDDHHIDLGYRNYVDEVAAYNAEDGSMVTLKSRRNLTVGSVDAKPTVDPADGHAYFAAIAGVGTTYTGPAVTTTDDNDDNILAAIDDTIDGLAGDILIESEGSLLLDYTVNAMTADVRLVAQGEIVQDDNGLITANELGVRQNRVVYDGSHDLQSNPNRMTTDAHDIDLCAENLVDVFAASNVSDEGLISFKSTRDLATGWGTAFTNQAAGFMETHGVVSESGDIELESEGMLTLTEEVVINNPEQAMAMDAADTYSYIAATAFNEVDASNVQVGDANLTVIITNAGYTIDDYDHTSNYTVRIMANGEITQDAAIVAANELGVRQTDASDDVDIILGLENVVNEFAAENLSDGGQVIFRNTQDLTIGNVAEQTVKGHVFGQTNGVATTYTGPAVRTGDLNSDGDILDMDEVDIKRGDILIDADGSLTLDVDETFGTSTLSTTAIRAGSSGNADVRLIADGPITQDADGLIVANELGIRLEESTIDDLNIDLCEANTVDEIAALNLSNGGMISFNSTQSLIVGIVEAHGAQNASFTETDGVTSSYDGLAVTTQDLDRDGDPTEAGEADVTSGDIFLSTGGSLFLGSTVIAGDSGNADVRFVGSGTMSQEFNGLVYANEFGVRQRSASAGFDIDFGYLNQVDEFAASNASSGGEVVFQTTENLTIGVLDEFVCNVTTGAFFDNTYGVVTTDGNVLIETGGSLSLDASGFYDNMALPAVGSFAIDAMSGDVRIVANGDIRQDADGLIRANALGVRQEGTVHNVAQELAAPTSDMNFDIELGYQNQVDLFAAENLSDGGQITFQSTEDLTIGAVSEDPSPEPLDDHAFFAATTGVKSTYTGPAVVSRDLDGNGDFTDAGDVLDVLDGDILIVADGAISIEEEIEAGTSSTADIRLLGNGAISETGSGVLMANELNVRQESTTSDTHITLTAANMVDEFAAYNVSPEGDILYTDADSLNINVLTAQDRPDMMVTTDYASFTADGMISDLNGAVNPAISNVAVGSHGGDITIEAGLDLTVIGTTGVEKRRIFSTDGVVDETDGGPLDGENITLRAVVGDVNLGGEDMNSNELGYVVITTDENSSPGVSAEFTNDNIFIQTTGTFFVHEGVELRTDGGVALAFAPRPISTPSDAFFNGDGNPIEASISPTLIDGVNTVAAFTVEVGVTGEENLLINFDWDDPNNDTPGSVAGLEAFELMVANDVDSAPTQSRVLVEEGGLEQQFGHLYTYDDVNEIVQNQDGLAHVKFGVSHHDSIVVEGTRVEQTGRGADNVFDGNITQTSDNTPNNGDIAFENGRAIFRFIPPQLPPRIEPDLPPEPNPAPPNPEPVIYNQPVAFVPVEAPVASRVGVSNQSFDYFQLRRDEGGAEPIIIDERISEDSGESLLDPQSLRDYVRDMKLQDEQDYELWLITTKINNQGQSVTLERPILKFDVSGGRPIPAVEELPMEFPELRLEPIPLDMEESDPMPESGEKSEMKDGMESEKPVPPPEDDNSTSLRSDEAEQLPGMKKVLPQNVASTSASVGGVLAVSAVTRKSAGLETRRRRNSSILSRFFGSRTESSE